MNDIHAFPSTNNLHHHSGMTLRDWFAGQALISIGHNVHPPSELAAWTYRLADAMLKARNE